jgi:hypothetical protein
LIGTDDFHVDIVAGIFRCPQLKFLQFRDEAYGISTGEAPLDAGFGFVSADGKRIGLQPLLKRGSWITAEQYPYCYAYLATKKGAGASPHLCWGLQRPD